ncbi:MAG: hypothetical protein ABI692_10845 [Terracoccus sp.]
MRCFSPSSRGAAIATGAASGFATMTPNAAGPVMTPYLVAQGVEKRPFVGTGALFFVGVDLIEVPFKAGLGLLGGDTFSRTVVLAPIVLVGASAGLRLVLWLTQAQFEQAVPVATVSLTLALVVR